MSGSETYGGRLRSLNLMFIAGTSRRWMAIMMDQMANSDNSHVFPFIFLLREHRYFLVSKIL